VILAHQAALNLPESGLAFQNLGVLTILSGTIFSELVDNSSDVAPLAASLVTKKQRLSATYCTATVY